MRPAVPTLLLLLLMSMPLTLLLAAPAVAEPAPQKVLGTVVSVRGAAYAKAPGEERRVLGCHDPIFEGDELLTQSESALGVDADGWYARLGADTRARADKLASGGPRLDLEVGHVRLLEAGSATPVAAVATPGLEASPSGRDSEALVFAEKAGAVSMVCAYDDALEVSRRGRPGDLFSALAGQCVVGKPREALFGADASHPRLAVLARDACDDLPILGVADLFSPNDVALGPIYLGGGPNAPSPSRYGVGANQLLSPCSSGPSCTRSAAQGGGPGLPTGFPNIPPPPTPAP